MACAIAFMLPILFCIWSCGVTKPGQAL